jgi:predicted GNAT superfamily acetyltransferase
MPAPTARDVPALLDRDGDEPRPGTLAGAACTVATPADVERLRADHPDLAVRWRMAVREALTSAVAAGYRIDGITRNGHYLLEKR